MDWKQIVGKAAPMLGTLLLGPAGGAVAGMVASAFGVENQPDKISAAIAADPQAAIKLRKIELDNKEALERMTIENETARILETNKTIQAEIQSNDPFVRRARPMFLYVTAFSIGIEVLIAMFIVLVEPARIGDLGVLYTALATPQSIAAAMCGVYLKKRSDDKQTAAGIAPGPGLLAGLLAPRAG